MSSDWLPSGAGDDTGAGWVLGGRYRLISQVGIGGMAVVWQAHDSVLDRTVAVKVLATHAADDPKSRERIRREARAAAALSHPNIAQVYDYGEADVNGGVTPYVVMELVRGDSLQQRLIDGPVLPGYAMRVCAEIAAALAAAHTEGLVHRDIKPANVMLAPTGAKVVDFGIAAAIQPTGSGDDNFELLGTPAYVAPERLLHDAVQPASDVYALGVLLYRLLAGHSPWTSETTTQMLNAHVYLEPEPLLPMFQVPDYVTTLCNRCLDKDPTRRPSAREAAALLARGAGVPVVTDEPSTPRPPSIDASPSVLIRGPGSAQPAPPTSSRKRRMYALLAAAVLAAVAATIWLPPTRHDAESAPPPAAGQSAASPPPGGSTTPSARPRPTGVIDTAPPRGEALAPSPSATGGPKPTVTATATATTTANPPPEPEPEPIERTLSSEAGSVRATCPDSDTAQILSWAATKPYKVIEGDQEAGPAPAVSFKHGNRTLTMTVTCDGGTPSATST